jgi:multisubunit Na+/H+ antiporter MnhB subunit
MKRLLRRLRGIVGTGVTWAAGWGALSGGMFAVLGSPLGVVLEGAAGGAFLGGFAGASFAVILSLAEGRRTLRELSLRRVAAWGGIGGMALLLAVSPLAMARMLAAGIPLSAMLSFIVPLGISGILGAGFATGSVALAKREEVNHLGGEEVGVLTP